MKSLLVFGRLLMLIIVTSCLNCTIGENTPTTPEEEQPSGETIPIVTTRQVTDISGTQAKSGGEIHLDLKNTIIDRGVCWSKTDPPTIEDKRTFNGTGPGNFSSTLDSLENETQYYVRAFAESHAGMGYGESVPFKTTGGIHGPTINDIDGNIYHIVKIGEQWWMAENLKTSHYRNGDSISLVTDNQAWTEQTGGACCYYNNNTENYTVYGTLYNWHAVTDFRNIAPEGWHVPSDADWMQLEQFLGMKQVELEQERWRGDNNEGGRLKSDSELWYVPNDGGYNNTGFSALPAGFRSTNNGEFIDLNYQTLFWTTTEKTDANAYCRALYHNSTKIGRAANYKIDGYSVRCVKDE